MERNRGGVSSTFWVYVSERGNIFMTEVAALIAAALEDLGYETVFPAPDLPEPGLGRVNLVVAPHEFFTLQPGYSEAQLLAAAESCVCVGVEQPGTEWFELGTHYASVGRAILDISPYAIAELERRGLDAVHLQLGYHPSLDRWGGNLSAPRPVDLLFMGAFTPRRDRLLSQAAPLLWDCHADIRLFEFPRPMDEPRGVFVAGREKLDLLASARVLLNIHQGEAPYFEWVRVLEAVANGCLVVSEESAGYGPLMPGEHFVAAGVEDLAAYAASLVIDDALRREMANSAYDFVRTKLEFTSILEPISHELSTLGSMGRSARPALPFQPSVPAAAAPNPVLVDALATEMRARGRIKELYDLETTLLQEVEAIQATARFGDPDHAFRYTTPAWEGFEPDVSVVITCYNYARFVREAVDSVLASQGVRVELVIVDDHSDDDSVAQLRGALAECSSFPITLVARTANAGVARARNVGISTSRADLIYMLDADNSIHPQTLSKLAAALADDPEAAFAYGVVARSDGSGLLSCLPWDVTRLCCGNYIDTMAMIRRGVLEELGGYDEYFGLKGWEDYDLWLRVASMGGHGVFVREFLGSYRVHGTSRQTKTALDTASLMASLRERYPHLPWN